VNSAAPPVTAPLVAPVVLFVLTNRCEVMNGERPGL